jgi:hypothetical protein
MGFSKVEPLHRSDNGKLMYVIKSFLGIHTVGLCVDMAQDPAETIV